ncbi:cytochrome b/b6 domain-containing protein [Microbacterium sp.]|uniref:cytochrome b/b6 domain-containing protein n=1 Tax=Microbacterium sp. TaxID=51671 RepID=UPI00356AD0EB
MATRMLRRGLPRVAGGEPWPPAGDVEVADAVAQDAAPAEESAAEEGFDSLAVAQPVSSPQASPSSLNDPQGAATAATALNDPQAAVAAAALRRGLPRTPGGEPWPPADAAQVVAAAVLAPTPTSAPTSSADSAATLRGVERAEGETKRVEQAERVETAAASAIETSTPAAASAGDALRRGLPRTPGGEPWPPAGTAANAGVAVPAAASVEASGAAAATTSPSTGSGIGSTGSGIGSTGSGIGSTGSGIGSTGSGIGEVASSEVIPASTTVATVDVSTPLPFQRTVFPGKNAFTRPAPKPEPKRIGPFTKVQWAGAVIVGGIGLLGAAAMAVLFVRWLLSLSGMQDFLQTYPGEYHLPEGAPVGFPGWLGWQHFFNVFLMVLIIRSGLSVRNDKRPTAFWTARGKAKSKISLTLWFHQSLDILWLVNGIIFVILLFVTGQWMRVIPTSWEVFPNAISAVLQYISLDWPTENGWVNYNSIQQITYFVTIFIAAPLAAITGVRMSGIWPKNADKLNKAYPVEWARALHFPVMLYFVVFIAIHVFLVFATGALRNLNHMYAAQGSTDPNTYADNWTGFWFLVASLVVIAAAWVAARPLVLAPIAKLFGNVSAR